MATEIYHPVPGVGTGRFGFQFVVRSRMYQGPDHLLVVQSTGYTEDYRRIFYRDVRYIDVRKSNTQLVQALISGGFILLFALLAMVIPLVAALIFASPFILWFVVNLALGPTCACFVTTSVQTLQIPAPRRHRKIPQIIAFLRERAEAPAAAELSGAPVA